MKNFKLNNLVSFLIILFVIAGIGYFAGGRSEKEVSKPLENKESTGWKKAEYKSTPEGLPGFSFNYRGDMSLEDNGGEPNTVEDKLGEVDIVRIFNIEDQEKVINGEISIASTSADIINICVISANCFSNLPDVIGTFDTMGDVALEEVGTVTYGENTYTIYKDPTSGNIPVTIYALHFAPGKIFAVSHLGNDNPPTTIDLASVNLIFE